MRPLTLALFLLCSLLCQAQEPEPGAVRCRFITLANLKTPPTLVNISPTGAESHCKVEGNRFSEEKFCYANNGIIPFQFLDTGEPAASAKLPGKINSAILVVLPAPKNTTGLPWKIFVIDDSQKNFPFGGALVANFHRDNIAFVVGEHKIKLRPGMTHGFARPEQRDDFNMSVVNFQFQQGEAWRSASESKLRFIPAYRYLMFAYIDPGSGRPRLNTLKDFKPPPPPPKD